MSAGAGARPIGTPPPEAAPLLWSLGSLRAGARLLRNRGPNQVLFWFIALAVGIAAGLMTVLFRQAVSMLQTLFYGSDDLTLHSTASDLPWFVVLVLPILGGLAVGIILHRFTADGRVRSVADVIEGAAIKEGRVERREGLASAAASLITLSTGGSTGREGPVVHIAAMISSQVSDWMAAGGIRARDIMGCAVAAAVSASFNAPIAGALFALEVVLRHFAIHAFAPIVVASVAGAVVSRLEYGNVTEFTLQTATTLEFYVELPAFLMLGLVCGLVAAVLMQAVLFADHLGSHVQARTGMPRWLRPSLAGVLLGLIATQFPHIIGVGYETTSKALIGGLTLGQATVFAVVKVVAVAITMGGRMGGGIFSPSLMLGALTGLAFGTVATALFPNVSGSETLYALAGMGAVAAAVLGAPISTTLIVFELTGDWQTGLAVMVAVSLSTALASKLVKRSFFLTQLARRGIPLAAGPQDYLPAMIPARSLMRPAGSSEGASRAAAEALIAEGIAVPVSGSLAQLMPVFTSTGAEFLPLVEPGATPEDAPVFVGAVFRLDALEAYVAALARTAREEHS